MYCSIYGLGICVISTAILTLLLIQVGRKNVHYVLVNGLSLSLPRKSVDRLTDCLDMTIVVDCNNIQTNKQSYMYMYFSQLHPTNWLYWNNLHINK